MDHWVLLGVYVLGGEGRGGLRGESAAFAGHSRATDDRWEDLNGIMYETLLRCSDLISICANLIWLAVQRLGRIAQTQRYVAFARTLA